MKEARLAFEHLREPTYFFKRKIIVLTTDQDYVVQCSKLKIIYSAHLGYRGTQNRAPGELSLCTGHID